MYGYRTRVILATIRKIEHIENKDTYALVHVLLSDGELAVVWVGGEVSVRHDPKYDKIVAFVKRRKTK